MAKKSALPASTGKQVVFTYKLEGSGPSGRLCVVLLPPKIHTALGGDKARIPVIGKADTTPIRTSAMPMGGCHMFVFTRELQIATGKGPGDSVSFVLCRDTQPRTIDPPADFKKALAKNSKAKTIFEALSFTHRKEYVRWIEEAKKPETRVVRIEKAVGMIAQGKGYK